MLRHWEDILFTSRNPAEQVHRQRSKPKFCLPYPSGKILPLALRQELFLHLRAPSHFPARAISHITLSPHHRDVCVTVCLRIQKSYLWPHSLPNGRRENSLYRSSSGLHSPATLSEVEACARRQPSRVKKVESEKERSWIHHLIRSLVQGC